MNDYWDYLAHARKAKERDDHKYVARVEVGTKNGRAVYRYFYDETEYRNYLSATGKKKPTAAEELKSFGQKIRQTVADTANAAKETAANAAKSLKTAAVEAGEKIKNTIADSKEKCSKILKAIGSIKVSEVSTDIAHDVQKLLKKADKYHEVMKVSSDKERTKNAFKSGDVSVMKGHAEKSDRVLAETAEDAVRAIQNGLDRDSSGSYMQDTADAAVAYELRSRGYNAYPVYRDSRPSAGKTTVNNPCIDQMFTTYLHASAFAINSDGSTIDFTDYQNRKYFENNEEWYLDEIRKIQDKAHSSESRAEEEYYRDIEYSLAGEYLNAKSAAHYAEYQSIGTDEYALQKQAMEKRSADYKKYHVDGDTIINALRKNSDKNTRGVITYQNWDGGYECLVYEVDGSGKVTMLNPALGNANVSMKSLRMYNVCYVPTNELTVTDIVFDHVYTR